MPPKTQKGDANDTLRAYALLTHLPRCAVQMGHICALGLAQISPSVPTSSELTVKNEYRRLKSNRKREQKRTDTLLRICSFLLSYPNNFEPLYFIWLKTARFSYRCGDRRIHCCRISANRSHTPDLWFRTV